MRRINEIEIKEDVKIGSIILEAGDKIRVLKEASAAVFAIQGYIDNPQIQNYIKTVIDDYNIIRVVANGNLHPAIKNRVAITDIATHINELKVIADTADVNTLILWPYIEPALEDRVIVLEMPEGNF